MSRTEWLTICAILCGILAVNIFTLTYQVFIWRDVCDMWRIILQNDFYTKALHYNRDREETPNG